MVDDLAEPEHLEIGQLCTNRQRVCLYKQLVFMCIHACVYGICVRVTPTGGGVRTHQPRTTSPPPPFLSDGKVSRSSIRSGVMAQYNLSEQVFGFLEV